MVRPRLVPHAQRWLLPLPDAEAVRAYLLDTLETTLELLEHTPEEDDALYFFRMALFHEDLRGEELVTIAQTTGIPLGLQLPDGIAVRPPLLLPATRWTLGWSDDASFALDIERGHEPVQVPAFEIDAQPVTWAQYVEFIDDGGYDRQELWQPAGLGLAGARGRTRRPPRSAPRGADRVASGAVLQTMFGKPARMGATQVVMHANWWEAEARALVRAPPADRGRMGDRRHPGRAPRFPLGRRARMDRGHAAPVRRLPPDAWAPQAEMEAHGVFGKARACAGGRS